MSAAIIDGKKLAEEIRHDVKREIEELGIEPEISVLIVGNDPASLTYVNTKAKACKEVGIRCSPIYMSENDGEEVINATFYAAARNKNVTAMMVQLPLPEGIDEKRLLRKIPTWKDVDGMNFDSAGRLWNGVSCFPPCTPAGVIRLIKSTGADIKGKHAVIVGRSNIVGKPLAAMLLEENATVTICHSKTERLADITRTADILVAAVGRPNFIKGEMVKEGAIVIDVGTNRVDGKLVGDVEFSSACEKASFITPVPGGVGPMTVAMLLKNTLEAYKRRFSVGVQTKIK